MQVTIAPLSIAVENERIDSQFFHPEYLNSYQEVLGKKHCPLSTIAYVSDGNHLKIAESFDESEGIRYLRGQDLDSNMILKDRNIVYIPEKVFDSLARSHIFKNDILVTIVGANTGLVGLVDNPPEKLVANCKLGIIRADKRKIAPPFLYAFLISKYGQHQMLRSIRGGGQTGLILPDIRKLNISRFSDKLETNIENAVIRGHSLLIEAKEKYKKAGSILLDELGLLDWQPKHQLSFVRPFSETQEAERIDAEYFQPKYEEMIEAIKGYSGGWDTLGKLVTLKKGVEVGSSEYIDEGVPFIRISDLTPQGLSQEKCISESLYKTLSEFQPKKGEILFSKDGSPGIAFHLSEEPEKMVTSGGILRLSLKSKKLSASYLALVLNSILVNEQMKRDVGGSIILHWRPDQIKKVVIPILDQEIQSEIETKIQESVNLRSKSQELLEFAKRAVEMAVETDEETAIAWLESAVELRS